METLERETPLVLAASGARWPARVAPVLAEIIRVALASVLLFGGLVKLHAPYEFLASVYGYELTGPLSSLIIATVLPWLEVVAAICLWGKICYRGALAVSILLGVLFSVAVGIALYRQLDISCGCFLASDKISYLTLLRAVLLLLAAAAGLLLASREAKSIS